MTSPEWPAALRRAALCCWANSLERPPGFAETPGSQLGLPALPMAISFMLHRVLLTLHWATAALASKGLGAASLEIVACRAFARFLPSSVRRRISSRSHKHEKGPEQSANHVFLQPFCFTCDLAREAGSTGCPR